MRSSEGACCWVRSASNIFAVASEVGVAATTGALDAPGGAQAGGGDDGGGDGAGAPPATSIRRSGAAASWASTPDVGAASGSDRSERSNDRTADGGEPP